MYRKHLGNLSIITLIITSAMLLVYAMKGIYPFGDGLISWGDMTQQTLPLFYYAYDMFTGQAVPYFSWRFSGGINMSGVTSEWSLLSPFNLPLLLTERSNIYRFVSVLLIFKMVCMGCSMYLFSLRYNLSQHYHILAGVLYGLSSCALIHYQLGFMLDIAIIFPLLMIGFYTLMEKEVGKLYVAMLALCLVLNVYISFMVFLYLFCLSAIYFKYKMPTERFLIKCRQFAWHTALAVGISAFVWVPAMLAIGHSGRLQNQGALLTYVKALTATFSLSSLTFFMGATLLAVVICLAWPNMRSGMKYEGAQVILLLLAVLIPGTELLWHGGSRVAWPVRFAFILTFVLIEVALSIKANNIPIADCFRISSSKKRNLLIVFGILSLIASIVAYATAHSRSGVLVLILGFVLLYMVTLTSATKHRLAVISILLTGEIIASIFLCVPPPMKNTTGEYQSINDYFPLATAIGTWEDIDDIRHPFRRVKNSDGNFNSNYAVIADTYALANFVHVTPKSLQDKFYALGYSIPWTRVLDTGGTAFSDSLMGVNDSFTVSKQKPSPLYEYRGMIGDTYWYRYTYQVPCGVALANDVTPNKNVFQYQNEIFQSFTGEELNLIEELSPVRDNDVVIPIQGHKELYLYADGRYTDKGIILDGIYINDELVPIPNLTDMGNHKYPATFNERLLDLGYFAEGKVYLHFDAPDGYNYNVLHIGLLDIDVLKQGVAKLRQDSRCNILSVGAAELAAEYIAQEPSLLFLPMNYDVGWQCSVNGSPVESKPVLGGFMAIPVSAGNNNIHLVFYPKGWKFGLVFTIATLLIGGVFSWQSLKLPPQVVQVGDVAIGKIYKALAVSVLFFVFILPIPATIISHIAKLIIRVLIPPETRAMLKALVNSTLGM